ncbi:hypothetical protein GGI42DRAFT_317490 [Trichoderma sp. SZMC 28013]
MRVREFMPCCVFLCVYFYHLRCNQQSVSIQYDTVPCIFSLTYAQGICPILLITDSNPFYLSRTRQAEDRKTETGKITTTQALNYTHVL